MFCTKTENNESLSENFAGSFDFKIGGLYENFWPYNHSKHGKYKFEIKFWEILGLSVKNSDFIKSKLNGLHRDHPLTLAFAYPSAWKVRETLTLKPH